MKKVLNKIKGLIEKALSLRNAFKKIENGIRISLSPKYDVILHYYDLEISYEKFTLLVVSKEAVDIINIGKGECSDKSAKWYNFILFGFGVSLTVIDTEWEAPKKKVVKKTIKRKTTAKKKITTRKKRKTSSK